MQKEKLIIGGGISGLIWNFLNPEYKIITPEIGGSYGHTHMVWLHDTHRTRDFLEKLGFGDFRRMTKKSPIGYYHRGWVYDHQSTEVAKLMIQKKMTEWNKPLDISFQPDVKQLTFSEQSGVNYMNTLDVDLVEMVKRLRDRCSIENGFVTEIKPGQIVVKKDWNDLSGEVRYYDKLVSTIPAPFFWKTYGKEREFKSLPITNVIVSKRPDVFDDRYSMIYYDETIPFSRASFVDGKWALEFTGEITQEEFERLYPNLPVESCFVVKQGRIFPSENNEPPQDNILFLGRFSEWKYGILTENVIQKTIDLQGKF